MKKTLMVNAGSAILLNERSTAFEGYDSVQMNAGSVFASRVVYEKLSGMDVMFNSGNLRIVDITGEVVEVSDAITGGMNYAGKYLYCVGNLVIEDIAGLDGVTGLYARNLFYADDVAMEGVPNVTAQRRIVYPGAALLRFGDCKLDNTTAATLAKATLHWVHGTIKALDEPTLARLREKAATFHCEGLVISESLYAGYGDLFETEKLTLVPDGCAVVEDIELDAATAAIYGDKLYVLGDMTIAHDQAAHLDKLAYIYVDGEVRMPTTAAAAFRAIGEAQSYDLYEGVLIHINGVQTFGHEQCRTAIRQGLTYTLNVDGTLYFMQDVTPEDMQAIASIRCNGVISAPDAARGALDSKLKHFNGVIVDLDAMLRKFYGEDFSLGENPIAAIQRLVREIQGGEGGSIINTGSFKL